jgi:hypothetical protein
MMGQSGEDPVFIWLVKEEEYLHHIRERCLRLAMQHKESFNKKRYCYKAPSVVLSSISGALAIGITALPADAHQGIAIAAGLVSAAAAAALLFASPDLRSVESISAEMFEDLHDDIERELATPLTARTKTGAVFLRDAYNRFHSLLVAPNAEESDLDAYVGGVEADIHRVMSMAAAPPLSETPSPTTSSDDVLPQRARPSTTHHGMRPRRHHTGKSRLSSTSADFSIDMLPDSDDDDSAKA